MFCINIVNGKIVLSNKLIEQRLLVGYAFRRLQMADQLDLQKIDAWQRQGEIDKVLEYTDSILLRKGLNLTEHEIELLHSIWKKMCGRRMTRKNQSE